jgi:hypothetical protein
MVEVILCLDIKIYNMDIICFVKVVCSALMSEASTTVAPTPADTGRVEET